VSPGVPTGVVHGGEFVFDAEATRYWTPEYLESMRAGNAPPGPGGGVNVAVFDSRHGADQWLSSGSGRGIVLDIIRQTRHEFVG
jgi:hypothetical protein